VLTPADCTFDTDLPGPLLLLLADALAEVE
jgi:hypothetical protein